MTREQAEQLHQGDKVIYGGKEYTIASVKVRGIAAPHFRLNGLSDDEPNGGGMVSWQLCSLPSSEKK